MFRIVTEFIPEPAFLAMCSHLHCGEFMTVACSALGPDLAEQQRTFVAQLCLNGWHVALDAIYCARHVAKSRAQEKLISVPQFALQHRN